MSLYKKILILILLIIPTISLIYKKSDSDIEIIPQSISHSWNISVTYPIDEIIQELDFKDKDFLLPTIRSTQTQNVTNSKFIGALNVTKTESPNGTHLFIDKKLRKLKSLTNSAQIEILDGSQKRPLISPLTIEEKKILKTKFLNIKSLKEETLDKLKELNKKIISATESKSEIARKIYFYLIEEVPLDEDISNIDEALELSSGSSLVQAEIFTYLCRLNNIPARINITYQIKSKKGSQKLVPIFIPEALLKNDWYLAELTLTPFSKLKEDFFVFYKNYEDFKSLFNKKLIHLTVNPVLLNQVDSKFYSTRLKEKHWLYALFSLHHLPITLHSVFFTVLLIPIGTLILSFARNIVGLKSFGIFTPILLALFFLETSLLIGFIFFTFIVLLGFGQRYFLDKLYLLAIPRLSVLLTLVIISYTLFSLLIYQNSEMFQITTSLNYLPIVIITGFIERFSIHFIEEGAVNTFKALIGTIIISMSCYVIFQLFYLKRLLFNNPELLLVVIALNILIGSYKGFRFSEVLRFKEFGGKSS